MRLEDLTLQLHDNSLITLATVTHLEAVTRDLVPGYTSVALADVEPPGRCNILAWMNSAATASTALEVIVGCLRANSPVVDLRKLTRPATREELTALGGQEFPGRQAAQLASAKQLLAARRNAAAVTSPIPLPPAATMPAAGMPAAGATGPSVERIGGQPLTIDEATRMVMERVQQALYAEMFPPQEQQARQDQPFPPPAGLQREGGR